MATTADIPDDKIPQYARRCLQRYLEATQNIREAEKESLGLWKGGKHQWLPGETESRVANNQPWLSINRCRPAVFQVENEARSNPSGPKAEPVGGGADSDGADIIEGLIREYEYRSDAKTAYLDGAFRMALASGRGVFEMGTEYVGPQTLEQQIIIKPIIDPSTVFCDPDAIAPGLVDSMWGGKLRKLSRQQLIEQYPDVKLNVLDRNKISQAAGAVMEWLDDRVGWSTDSATLSTWTGGNKDGPYYVCEFWRVIIISKVKSTQYSDGIWRTDKEDVPEGVSVKMADGEPVTRIDTPRKIVKYVVTAMDVIAKTEWYGSIIPYFWVLGPECYLEEKRYRASLLTDAKDAQRGLNFAATSAATITGGMALFPFMGPEGSFDVQNASGENPWDNTNGKMFSRIEYKPVFVADPNGNFVLAPPPQRNTWEAPIQRVMELATWFGEQIKAATSVFFEPTQLSAAQAQSGAAIKALQAQTNIGTAYWQDTLQAAQARSYQEAQLIMSKLYDGPRVRAIVRPDTKQEIAEINREFPKETHEPVPNSSKFRNKQTGKLESSNSIRGNYAVRVMAGPKQEIRRDKTIDILAETFKVMPALAQNPAIMAAFLRYVGEGDPDVEALADQLAPNPENEGTPQQMQQQLIQAQAQGKAQGLIIQKLQQAIQSKLPEIEAKKWQTAVESITKLASAEITASKDGDRQLADLISRQFETLAGFAHDARTQAVDHAHEVAMAGQQQEAAAQGQQTDIAAQQQAAESQETE